MNPGEYLQPFARKVVVNVPVISGYVTSRLRADDSIAPAISGDNTFITVTFQNVGNVAVGLKLQQTNDNSISGTRIDVISGISLVPGGFRVATSTSPYQAFLELYCYDGGPSSVRMQIDSTRQWQEQGFDKIGDATFYPPQLWQVKQYPVATSFTT